MKHRGVAALLVLLMMFLMGACGSGAESATEKTDSMPETMPAETAGTELTSAEMDIGEDGAMICDIGNWQAYQNENFGEAYERMNAGDTASQLDFELPPESGSTEDADLVFETFTLLTTLNVYTNHGYSAPETEETDQFVFSWPDGLTCTLRFSEEGVFQTEDGVCFDSFGFVGDWSYEEIRETLLFRYSGRQPEENGQQGSGDPQLAGTLEENFDYSDGFFEWDADGDGNAEKFEINFYRNGDEAPDVLEITVVSGSVPEGEILISGAYDITGLTAETDKEGPSLLISYTAGDYYSHDAEAKSRVRLRDGVFETEEIKP